KGPTNSPQEFSSNRLCARASIRLDKAAAMHERRPTLVPISARLPQRPDAVGAVRLRMWACIIDFDSDGAVEPRKEPVESGFPDVTKAIHTRKDLRVGPSIRRGLKQDLHIA